jgi:solute carrier family 25 phosphate transporter 23/24/25/41
VEEGLRRRGIAVSDDQLGSMLGELDANKDRRISASEFDAFCDKRRADVRRVFRDVDADGDGQIDSKELRRAVERAGLKISDEQLRAAFKRMDLDRDGRLSFEEFESTLMLLPHGANPEAVFDAFAHRAFVDDPDGFMTMPRDIDTGRRTSLSAHMRTMGDTAAGDDAAGDDTAGDDTAGGDAGVTLGDGGGSGETIGTAKKLASGGVAGAVSRSATAPIDRIKTIMQAGRLPTGIAPAVSSPRVTLASAARAVWSDGGWAAFWRGNGANVAKVVPETATKYVAFDALKKTLASDPGNATVLERFAAGGMAGAAAQTVVYPLEIVKTRVSLSAGGCSMATVIAGVLRAEGVRGLFKGLTPSLVGIFPYAGIDLMTNSVLKDALAAKYAEVGRDPGVAELLGCGMASSTSAMLVTYPLNLVRTRLQASGMPGQPTYSGPVECAGKILAKEGFAGLYRGLVPNLAKVLPATSVSYAVYDVLSSWQRRKGEG